MQAMTDDQVGFLPPIPKRKPSVINTPRPKAPGQVLRPEDLSPEERRLLQAADVDITQPIPDDLAERAQVDLMDMPAEFMSQVEAAANLLPPDFKLPTNDLKPPEEEPLGDPAALKPLFEKYAAAQSMASHQNPPTQPAQPQAGSKLKSVMEAARSAGVEEARASRVEGGLPPNIAEALRDTDTSIAGARAPDAEQKPTTPQEPPKDGRTPEQIAEEDRAKLLDRLRSRIPKEEQDNYREALITFSPYVRKFKLVGGSIEVAFRDIGSEEQDMIIMQEAIDRRKGRWWQTDVASQLYNSNRYTAAASLLSVKSLKTGVAKIDLPIDVSLNDYLNAVGVRKVPGVVSDLDDTVLWCWYQYLSVAVMNGPMFSLLMQVFNEFFSDLEGLRRLAREPDFS